MIILPLILGWFFNKEVWFNIFFWLFELLDRLVGVRGKDCVVGQGWGLAFIYLFILFLFYLIFFIFFLRGWWAARFVRYASFYFYFLLRGSSGWAFKRKRGGGFFFLYRACGCFFFGGVRGWFCLRGKSGRLFFLCSRWALGGFFVCFLVYRVVF